MLPIGSVYVYMAKLRQRPMPAARWSSTDVFWFFLATCALAGVKRQPRRVSFGHSSTAIKDDALAHGQSAAERLPIDCMMLMQLSLFERLYLRFQSSDVSFEFIAINVITSLTYVAVLVATIGIVCLHTWY